MTSLCGWELLYKSVEADIRSNQDVLVCFTHLVLISNGFKCVGLGDSKILNGTETESELLPPGWNENYALRYVYQGHLYNLQATNMDDSIMVNLIRVQERTVSMVQLNLQCVLGRNGNLEQVIPNHDELEANIKAQLINKVVVSVKYKDDSSQTTEENQPNVSEMRPLPHIIPNPYVDFIPGPLGPLVQPFFDPIRNIGRPDLNPFPAGPSNMPPGAGGMLFVPPRRPGPFSDPNTGIAPGSIPPGARFDPFRPPEDERGGHRQRRPDNDEPPPPDFDDVFM